MWVGFVTIKISVFGAKMLSSPETPGISPETPGFEDSGRNSGYRPGNSGFWDTPGETPGIGPETPDFRNPDTPGMSPEIPGFNRTVGCRIG